MLPLEKQEVQARVISNQQQISLLRTMFVVSFPKVGCVEDTANVLSRYNCGELSRLRSQRLTDWGHLIQVTIDRVGRASSFQNTLKTCLIKFCPYSTIFFYVIFYQQFVCVLLVDRKVTYIIYDMSYDYYNYYSELFWEIN